MSNENKKTELTEENRKVIRESLQAMNEFSRFFQYDVLNYKSEDLLKKALNDNGNDELDNLQKAINQIALEINEEFFTKR